jgi:hypothetical protein
MLKPVSKEEQESKFERIFTDIVTGDPPAETKEDADLQEFARRLRAQFEENEKLRRPKETEWLENLRQHKGIYDPNVLALIPANASRVYPKITRARDNTVLSRLHEMLFPDKDKNWEIEPTPVPKVPLETVKEITTALITQDPETGQLVMPTPQQIKQGIKEYADSSCADMAIEMEDQLSEMDYSMRVGKPTLKSGVLLGTGVVKGPLPISYYVTAYEATTDDIISTEKEKVAPYFQNIKIWNWYPDMNVTDFEEGEGCFERHVMSKHDVRKLLKRKGFRKETIKQYLTDHPNGDATKKPFEMDLEKLDERLAPKNAHEAPEATATQKTVFRKYEVLEYWGYVSGEELQAAGCEIPEAFLEEEMPATVWILGNNIIKAVKNDMKIKDIPYHPFYFDKDETSIFAEGLPRITRHSQLTVCAASRMLLNNAAICSGPQFEVNATLVINEDVNNIHPMKIWVREGRGVDAQYPAIRILNIDSHIPEYISIIDQFIKFGDIESTLPTWFISDPNAMANETTTGVSMRMSTMTLTVRDIVRNFDEHQESVIKALYAWNMEFNDKPEIKGDYKVRARGSSSLVTKEVRMQALNMFATTLTPEDWFYIPRGKFLEERVKANELDITIRTEEEAAAVRQSMIDERAKELGYRQAEAEIKKTESMALNLVTKAKKTNQEPPKGAEATDPIKQGLEHQSQAVDLAGKLKDMDRQDRKTEAEIEHIHAKTYQTVKKADEKPKEKEKPTKKTTSKASK